MPDTEVRSAELNDTLLNRIKFYCPPKSEPLIESGVDKQLKIAAIVSGRLNAALSHEAFLHLLTPENWRLALGGSSFDFLLIESCFESVTHDWYMGQLSQNAAGVMLRELVDYSKSLGIPTVYWLTKDSQYHGNYADFAALFDHVYCADPKEVELLSDIGVRAELLLPAVQPKIFNPYRLVRSDRDEIGVIYDGIIDVVKSASQFSYLRSLNVGLCDSNNMLFASKLDALTAEGWRVLGSVELAHKPGVLKLSKGVVSSSQSVLTPTEQQWMMVEAAACRVPLYHIGELPEGDVRRSLCFLVDSVDGLSDKIAYDAEDYLSWQRQAHMAWREVNRKHTYAVRLQTIVDDLGLERREAPALMASVLAPTYRKDFIPRVLATFRSQLYESKELIIVYNGNPADLDGVDLDMASNERIITLPSDMSAGACLNLAYEMAVGTHTFRMDDDDYYGRYYLLDSMLHLQVVDCEIYGKPPKFTYFEGERQLYARNVRMQDLQIFSSDALNSDSVWLAGNTIGLKKMAKGMPRYPDASVATADTFLALSASDYKLKVMCMDVMNVVVSRRADVLSHTWGMGADKLRQSASLVVGGISDVLEDQ